MHPLLFLRYLLHNILYSIRWWLKGVLNKPRERQSFREALGKNTVNHILISGDYTVQPVPLRVDKAEKLRGSLSTNDPSLLERRPRHAQTLRKLTKFSVASLVMGTQVISLFLFDKPHRWIAPDAQSGSWDSNTTDLFLHFLVYYLARHNQDPPHMHRKDHSTLTNPGDTRADVEADACQLEPLGEDKPRGEHLVFRSVLVPELGLEYSIPWSPVRVRGSEADSPYEHTRAKTVVVLTPQFRDKMSKALKERADFIIYLQDNRNSLDGYMERLGVLAAHINEAEYVAHLKEPRLVEAWEHKRYNLPDRSFPTLAWPGLLPSYSKRYSMPELVVVFSRYKHVHGIPPVALQRSQLLFLGELRYATAYSFSQALIDFAVTHQRNGK